MKYWLWVTRPEYYLDDNDIDVKKLYPTEYSEGRVLLTKDDLKSFKGRDILEPYFGDAGWWSCNKDVKKGDIILLYRSILYRNVKYIMTACFPSYECGKNSKLPIVKVKDLIREEKLRRILNGV